MNELFKNAKFGDRFRTRDGRCAILLQRYEGLCKMVGDANSGYLKYNVSDADGTALYPALGNMSIVSRWEEIDEDQIEDMAKERALHSLARCDDKPTDSYDLGYKYGFECGFIEGFYKAKQD